MGLVPVRESPSPTRMSDSKPRAPSAESSGDHWRSLPTEARNPRSEGLDTLSTDEIVALLVDEDRRGLDCVERERRSIARAAEWLAETLSGGGRALLLGAGTSGRLAILEAAECPPTFGTDPERIQGRIAGGEEAVFRAREGSEDRQELGRAEVSGFRHGDLVIGLSASSVTPYVRGALQQAREEGAKTVLLTCASPTGLDSAADLVIALDTGPEILTGSTRLKAGSATKAALNAITTAAMVRGGKAYGNLMVDLRPGSAKLRDRAVRIIESAGEVGPARARELYERSGHDVKASILMAREDLTIDEARKRLETADGHLRRALQGAGEEG